MTTVSSTFTAAGVSAVLRLDAEEEVDISISGTYVASVKVERAVTSDLSAWETILGPFSVDDATVAGRYHAGKNERLRFNCVDYTSGTVTYSMGDNDLPISELRDPAGVLLESVTQAGHTFEGITTVAQGAAGASTLTLPLGTSIEAALPPGFGVNDSFDFSLINISTVAAEDALLAVNTGVTIVGNLNVASNAAATDLAQGLFRVRRTA